ncbi:hypothetical protein GUITHDRAFT_152016 [Guillardia theta CCMP2712]|uniref:Uncharacterized protein n=2 Tax=Guillardia theta TaxID=55529 RepID=L1JGQ5_GUITC|nr:hypothetical protein GUITHDRAFT_152016 [Guillardia theta CCMP2712]EKX47512.1 hypothetical protein GUITHDRAFT_152016 [Guillardia theta CCMP2712]|eukprot:XP_005834492.1 hypothetical protein GUITHDRAFT_152016 [Guillardia theta CCMP2712]
MAHAGRRWPESGRRVTKPLQSISIDQQEFPSWVRQCDQDFKDRKCSFTHEMRTLEQWQRYCELRERSPYKRVACSKDFVFRAILPKVDLSSMPEELLRVEEEKPKKKLKKAAADKPQGRPRPRVDRGLALDEAAAALFGNDEALDGGENLRPEEQEGDGRGEKTTEDGEKQTREGEEEDGEDLEDEEDLEMDDYENAAEHCDDDEDLVDEGGGGSDDEEARYGTF